MAFGFEVLKRSLRARRGRLRTAHGSVETPVFMPVGTLATVKAVPQEVLEDLGAELLLGNTYHLLLRPGAEEVRRLGGLHRFMSWPGSLLTDSGGFQVFSLSKLRKLTEEGVEFRSHLDGSRHLLTPEAAMEAQIALGADIVMALDECPDARSPSSAMRAAMERTLRWAARSKRYFEAHKQERPTFQARERAASRCASVDEDSVQALFGIVQGGTELELRRESARRTLELGFSGYALGGLSVGEAQERTAEIVERALEELPEDAPRYLMGVGTPEEIVRYASMGVDMMDCVLPTRAARHGLLFTRGGRMNIKNARYAEDQQPPDERCGCPVCRRYTRAYLRHLFATGEVLALVLNSIHNLAYYLDTMRSVRQAIETGEFSGQLSDLPAPHLSPRS